MEKYNSIGNEYDSTRLADDYILNRIKALLGLQKDGIYLDIGCGTGNYTSKLYESGYSIMGMDPSELMITNAQKKYPSVDWRIGMAEDTGLEPKSVSGILATLTLHHWQDLELAFQEMDRILMDIGEMVIFTSTPMQMKGYWLNHYFPKMMQKSMEQMPPVETVRKVISGTGLQLINIEPYAVRPDLKDLFLYCGKHQPELYLNARIRNGISPFSHLANQNEVRKGIAQLERDISSGKIMEVIQGYEHNQGDYTFLVLTKDVNHNSLER